MLDRDVALLMAEDPFQRVCFMGYQGSGKTLSAVLYSLVKAELFGLGVVSNFQINYPIKKVFLREAEQLYDISNAILIWDEAQNDIDSRSFATNALATAYLTVGRKRGINLTITTQWLDQLDLRVRRIFGLYVHCEKLQGATVDENLYLWHLYSNKRGYDNWDDISATGYLNTVAIPHRTISQFFGMYDTLEVPHAFTKQKKKAEN